MESDLEANNLHIPNSDSLNIRSDDLRSNTIVVKRSPLSPKYKSCLPLLLFSVNLQSPKSQGKSAVLLDYILSSDIDLFAMTETWLRDKDTASKLEFIPTETYRFSSKTGNPAVLVVELRCCSRNLLKSKKSNRVKNLPSSIPNGRLTTNHLERDLS